MIWARLDAGTGLLSDIRQGIQQHIDDVPLAAMPIGKFGTKYTYDNINKLAVAVAERKLRTLIDIRADVAALSTAQKNAAWTNFTSGSPPLWSTDAGPNAAALATLQMLGASSNLAAADILEAKIRAVAMYVQDNVNYLVNPSFDATINVPGDELA